MKKNILIFIIATCSLPTIALSMEQESKVAPPILYVEAKREQTQQISTLQPRPISEIPVLSPQTKDVAPEKKSRCADFLKKICNTCCIRPINACLDCDNWAKYSCCLLISFLDDDGDCPDLLYIDD